MWRPDSFSPKDGRVHWLVLWESWPHHEAGRVVGLPLGNEDMGQGVGLGRTGREGQVGSTPCPPLEDSRSYFSELNTAGGRP